MRDPAVGPLGTKETQQFHRSTLRRNMQLAERDKGRIPAPLMGIQAAGWDCGMTVPVLDEAPDGVARQLIMIKVGRRSVWCGSRPCQLPHPSYRSRQNLVDVTGEAAFVGELVGITDCP